MHRLQNLGRTTRKTNGITASLPQTRYIGRFAPSPTGPLHFGSLYTALASYLQARAQHGLWRIRIDDLDTPRNAPGAADNILKTLENFGLQWDKAVIFQSARIERYHAALEQLLADNRTYRCGCTRKTLDRHQPRFPDKAHLYPGFCRVKTPPAHIRHALRIKTDARIVRFHDALQGLIEHVMSERHGDFIVLRRDSIIAYQLAAAVDDRLENITEVVRGYDLLDSTPKQIYLQQLLGYRSPHYMHVPVIVDAHGQKLSKQSYAAAVDRHDANKVLFEALVLLFQQPPTMLRGAPVSELLDWAIAHWNPALLQNKQAIAEHPLLDLAR
ncbi:MAG: tRNA glutamyl-Q(34) synthetase GluQRS [Gammaproteobacteria bacterium]